MEDKQAILEPERFYHIYNRANGSELLFRSDDNYHYFLRKYTEYISPIIDTFSYCLMPNHFHFLAQVKPENELIHFFGDKYQPNPQGFKNQQPDPQGFKNLEGLVASLLSKQFSHFFNAYSKAYNKQHGRIGSLFMHPYKRKLVDDEDYLRKLVHYIHFNPVQSGLCPSPEEWKFSSYHSIINSTYSMVKREKLLYYFSDLENFIYCHSSHPSESGINFSTSL